MSQEEQLAILLQSVCCFHVSLPTGFNTAMRHSHGGVFILILEFDSLQLLFLRRWKVAPSYIFVLHFPEITRTSFVSLL